MNAANDVIQQWLRAALWCALSAVASNPSGATAQPQGADAGVSHSRISFLSGPRDEATRPAEETPRAAPLEESNNFDGAWTFTSAGCRRTGSLPAMIVGGKIIIKGGSGQVDPDGTLHSVGAQRYDPDRSWTVVRKYGGRNIQSIRRLCRPLDRDQALEKPPSFAQTGGIHVLV
jgi:hypothetical protein